MTTYQAVPPFDWVFAIVIWGLIIAVMRRIQVQAKAQNSPIFDQTWSLFILVGLTFTLRLESLQNQIDYLINYKIPLAFILRCLAVLGALIYYRRFLEFQIETQGLPLSTRITHNMKRVLILPTWLGMGIISLGFLNAVGVLERLPTTYSVMFYNDLAAVCYMGFIFIPIMHQLYQVEHIRVARAKHGAVILFCIFYILAAVPTFVAVPSILITHEVYPERLNPFPLAPFVFACTVILLLPYQVLEYLLRPIDFYRYTQLHTLEWKIFKELNLEPSKRIIVAITNPFSPKLTEANYSLVISILDHYHGLPEVCPLKEKISNLITDYNDYSQLAIQLAKL